MKGIIASFLAAAISLMSGACGVSESAREASETAASAGERTSETSKADSGEITEENTMKITVGDKIFTADLADNSSAEAFKELLKKGGLTVEMHDYGNFEKVGDIGAVLPQNNEQITTEAGDIILYQGTSVTIYYDVNSWNFTRLGKIRDVTQKELKEALGKGNVTVTFSLA